MLSGTVRTGDKTVYRVFNKAYGIKYRHCQYSSIFLIPHITITTATVT